MKSAPVFPTRLAELSPEEDGDGMGALFRGAQPIPAPSDAARQLVKWRIGSTLARGGRRRLLVLRPALATLLVFASGGVVGASVHQVITRGLGAPEKEVASAVLPTTRGKMAMRSAPQHGPSAVPDSVPQSSPLAVAVKAPAPAVAGGARHALHRPPSPGATEPPQVQPAAAIPAAILEEQTLIATAVRRLRAVGDAASALEALDDHAARFPGGALAPEAATLRAEALLALGRRRDALHQLDALLVQPLPRSHQRRVLRGEVRVLEGLYQLAIEDFDRVLRVPGPDGEAATSSTFGEGALGSTQERALWGRTVARSRAGDGSGARADAAEYLRRFPHGHFAPDARRLVASP